ncbi:hypothetical protein HHI36_008931 [Cryptolaemus montrouzieri]|uniref:Uncharacterized protein n=1 Tax=Cryptolaemus montrouzieri TaxID=559131 RepID=A0ABD2MTX8_9CUCU
MGSSNQPISRRLTLTRDGCSCSGRFNILVSRRVLDEREIISLMNEEDKGVNDGSDSEIQDHVREDIVQSDEYVDEVMINENSNETHYRMSLEILDMANA